MSNSQRSKKEEPLGPGGKTYIWPNDDKALTYGDLKNKGLPIRTQLSPNYADDRCIPTAESNVLIGGPHHIEVQNASFDSDKIIIRRQITKEDTLYVFEVSVESISLAAAPPSYRDYTFQITSYKQEGIQKTLLPTTSNVTYDDKQCPSDLVYVNLQAQPGKSSFTTTYKAILNPDEFLLPGEYHNYPSKGTGYITFLQAGSGKKIAIPFRYNVRQDVEIGCPNPCPNCGRHATVNPFKDFNTGEEGCKCSNCGWSSGANIGPGGRS